MSEPTGHPSSQSTQRPVALITGGARRVGAAIARALAAPTATHPGCDLLLTANTSTAQADELASQLREKHNISVRTIKLDLAKPSEAEAFATRLASELPRLDIIVHNASIYQHAPLETVTEQQAIDAYNVHALSPMLITKHLAPLLAKSALASGGSIVAMGDIHVMGLPRAAFPAYAMSKAALLELVRTLAVSLAPHTRVNAVSPGVVAWPEKGYESDDAAQQAYLARVPLARPGTPEEAAEAVRWLALDAAYTTGQVIRVDGGRLLR